MGAALSHAVTSKYTSSTGNERFRVGSAEMQGYRIDMEDSISTHFSLSEKHPEISFFGVYDGHCGDKCSAWLERELYLRVGALDDPFEPDQLRDCVVKADADFLATDEKTNGSTCVFALVKPNANGKYDVIVANVGDSRALLLKKGRTFVPLSEDHKPENPEETERIIAAGGTVSQNRVDGELAMSRSIGDCKYKQNPNVDQCSQKVIPVPEMATVEAEVGDFLLVCCDGLFERLENWEVSEFTFAQLEKTPDDPTAVMRALLDHSLAVGSKDNMSATLVCFADGSDYNTGGKFYAGPFSHGRDDQQFVDAYTNDARKHGIEGEELMALAKEGDASYDPPAATTPGGFMQSAALAELIRTALAQGEQQPGP